MSKEILYSNSWKETEKNSVLAAMERNDCVVHAIASACKVSYEEAHAFVKDIFKRRDKKGTRNVMLKMSELSKAFNVKVTELGEKDEKGVKKLTQSYRMHGKTKVGRYTTVSFIKKFPTGTYIMFVRGHAFTIIDGVVHGNSDDATKRRVRVEQAFKVEQKS